MWHGRFARVSVANTAETAVAHAGLTALAGPAQFGQAAGDGGLEAAVGRLVVTPLLGQVGLGHPAAREVVRVEIALAVAELLGAPVVGVAQLGRDRQSAAGADVLAGLDTAVYAAFDLGAAARYVTACASGI